METLHYNHTALLTAHTSASFDSLVQVKNLKTNIHIPTLTLPDPIPVTPCPDAPPSSWQPGARRVPHPKSRKTFPAGLRADKGPARPREARLAVPPPQEAAGRARHLPARPQRRPQSSGEAERPSPGRGEAGGTARSRALRPPQRRGGQRSARSPLQPPPRPPATSAMAAAPLLPGGALRPARLRLCPRSCAGHSVASLRVLPSVCGPPAASAPLGDGGGEGGARSTGRWRKEGRGRSAFSRVFARPGNTFLPAAVKPWAGRSAPGCGLGVGSEGRALRGQRGPGPAACGGGGCTARSAAPAAPHSAVRVGGTERAPPGAALCEERPCPRCPQPSLGAAPSPYLVGSD